MPQYLHRHLILISILFAIPVSINAQGLYPYAPNETVRCNALFEMDRGYVSGVCVMHREESHIFGSLFNEFGISAIDFNYNMDKDKVKLMHVMGILNKKLIKRTMREDIRQLLHTLEQGKTTYVNNRRGIKYTLKPLSEVEREE